MMSVTWSPQPGSEYAHRSTDDQGSNFLTDLLYVWVRDGSVFRVYQYVSTV
jgi:hypothetical protein